MSRRESRNSLGGRQTSALEEFETFKKKYLLVNKHIAKLNSSLNVRIEELLGQIASLNNDNLKLRASEMSLHRKLENEQERTRRLYREMESASQLLISQISSMKVMFGLDKPAVHIIPRDSNAGSRPRATRQPHAPPTCRIARAPECDVITEAPEEESTPSKVMAPRPSVSPTATPTTPLGRRRSTGSTPHSTPASGAAATPGGTVYFTAIQGRNSDPERRSSEPMEITNGSSPVTPSASTSIYQSVLESSSTLDVHAEELFSSPLSDKGPTGGGNDGDLSRNTSPPQSTSIFNVPKLNLTGLKRVSRRPSGLVVEDGSRNTQLVSPPASSTDVNEPSAYPTPLSPPPAPSTPPKSVSTIRMPGSRSPSTPTRTLPMSPVPTNPALSPPPGRKLSLTRRQLDFGIPEPEEAEPEEYDAEVNSVEPVTEGLLSFPGESILGKRALKRKGPEDEEKDDADIFSAAVKLQGVRVKRQEKRRDTGNALTLKDKESRENLLKERSSKDSLRDVTNERTPPSLVGSKPTDINDSSTLLQKASEGQTTATTTSLKSHFSRGTVADLAAKLERLSSRPKPLSAPTPIPLPSSDKDVKIPLAGEEQANDAAEAAAAEMNKRGSGRQRKSVNYKEPSLNTKMRKPDPIPGPAATSSSAPSSSSTAGSSGAPTPTMTPTAPPRPPKRKKGSISLVSDINGSTPSIIGNSGEDAPTSSLMVPHSLYVASGDAESRRSSKLDLLEQPTGSVDIQRGKRNNRSLWEKYIDLSDEEDGIVGSADKNSPPIAQAESGGVYFSAETGSRYSFAGLSGFRGGSILAKGNNPIIGVGATPVTMRSTASLRVTPGAARERVRDELTGGAGARREREKEREREREQDDERGSKGIAI